MWLFNSNQPTEQLTQWALTRIQTSVGSFVLPLPPVATIKDLLIETNKLLVSRNHTHKVVAFVTVDGDSIEEDLIVSLCTERNQELIGLSETERSLVAPRVHSFFQRNFLFTPPPPPSAPAAIAAPPIQSSQADHLVKDPLPAAAPTPVFVPTAKDRPTLSIFLSYCWANSFLANGTEAVGALDPRVVRQHLKQKGFTDVWLDVEQMATGDDLFEQIANGLMSCDIVIVCVSDEYAVSKNCLRELNFALNVLKLPYIPLVVGDKFGWQKTKVGLMFGDQLYLDGTDPNLISERMENLVDALDKRIQSKASTVSGDQQESAILAVDSDPSPSPPASRPSSPDRTAPKRSNTVVLPTTPQDFDLTFSHTTQLKLAIGEVVEVLRWRQSKKSYYVSGGLHYVPVKIVEIGEPIDPTKPSSSRYIKVLFRSRVKYSKTRNGPIVATIINEDTEWVDEFLLRKVLEMPKNMPELEPGDAVEYRQYVKRQRRRKSVAPTSSLQPTSDAGSVVSSSALSETASMLPDDDDDDTYVFWPAYIVAKLSSHKFLLRQSRGMGLVAETGDYASLLKPVNLKLLRVGHDFRMIRVRQALNTENLVVLSKGSIVRRQCVPDIEKSQEGETIETGNKISDQIAAIMLSGEEKSHIRHHHPKKESHVSEDSSLRDQFLQNAKILWQQAIAQDFKPNSFKNTIAWLSHAFTNKSEGCGESYVVQPEYLFKALHHRKIETLNSETVVGDTTGLDDDEIRTRLCRGIVKCQPIDYLASIFLAILTPEYLNSPIHQSELQYAKALDLPIVYALVTPTETSQSLFTKEAYDFLKLISPTSIVDFTIRPLVWSRVDNLVMRINQHSVSQNQRRRMLRYKDESPDDLPWFRSFLNISSGAVLESLNCVLLENVELVHLDQSGNMTVEQPCKKVSVCGMAWTTHRSVMSFSSQEGDPRKATAQTIVSPAKVLNLTNVWVYEGGIEWDGNSSGKLQFKPTRLTRYVSQPDDIEEGRDWKEGDLVEVRLHWVSGDLGDQCLWWPCRVLKYINALELLVVMHHSETHPFNIVPVIKVTIAQMRQGKDPRAIKWFSPAQFSIATVQNLTENGEVVSTQVPRFRYGNTIADEYSVFMQSPIVKERASLKPIIRCEPEIRRAMREEDFHAKTLVSIMGPLELKKMVTRLPNDPNPDLWIEGVSVDETGTLIEFADWKPCCVTSMYPFLEKSVPNRVIYVEVEVLELGWCDDAGSSAVSIGPITQFYPPFQMVGWNGRSIGYHSLNGRKLKSDQPDYMLQGIPYSVGDIVGVGVDLSGLIYFTLNRRWIFGSKRGNSGIMYHLGVSADGPAKLRVNPLAEPDPSWL
ncbi:UNVERIFIED_CONTAM: hypothetical protein HDU68_003757 [Siphonaria sp. JEL0065]|nr:hypothetical protein HDU68_003757 [Siphonaria sp. JEL0065]